MISIYCYLNLKALSQIFILNFFFSFLGSGVFKKGSENHFPCFWKTLSEITF